MPTWTFSVPKGHGKVRCWETLLGMRENMKLQVFFSGIYLMIDDDNILAWWCEHCCRAPLFKQQAHNVHTRSSMATSTASSTVVMKELLNTGFGDGLDYLEDVTIH
ncbi:hypothetical protein B0H17DRAFT_1134483 [Mycena rosella]|uniref:Uncharacterized protein n=1 Tax=Mycena rosella TaxID=1033263 RepID=A0AAD7DF47_MYCRO|nr:hypothetical protein B0H17DRAFT_1134483 [Mycena rosella]